MYFVWCLRDFHRAKRKHGVRHAERDSHLTTVSAAHPRETAHVHAHDDRTQRLSQTERTGTTQTHAVESAGEKTDDAA